MSFDRHPPRGRRSLGRDEEAVPVGAGADARPPEVLAAGAEPFLITVGLTFARS